MGRRAKTKQSAPEPLHTKVYPTTKKLGKRKAELETDDRRTHPRPVKKLKDSRKVNNQHGRNESMANAPKSEDHAASSAVSSDGWEDIEDDYLASHTKTLFHDKGDRATSDLDVSHIEDDDEYDSLGVCKFYLTFC